MTIRPLTSKLESELKRFSSLDRYGRMTVLAILAHDLTVGIRSAISDLPSPGAIEKLQAINEYLHQITGRIHVSDENSGREECDLLRDIVENADAKGMKWVVVRRLGPALRHVSTHEHAPETA